MSKNIVIIGDGIAAWCMIYELSKTEEIKITQIASNLFAPCSLNTTSINCLRGTKKGLSALGDLMVDSYEDFLSFYNREKPEGIYKGLEVQFWSGETNFDRRYESSQKVASSKYENLVCEEKFFENEAYFITPQKFRNWIYLSARNFTQIQDTALEILDNKIICKSTTVNFDKVFVCTNSKSFSLVKGENEKLDYYLDHCKPVAGSFLSLNKKLDFKESINLAIGKFHFIYRSDSETVNIGSTTDNKCDFELPNESGLKEIYKAVTKSVKISIDDFNSFKKVAGIRLKGHKRLPRWEEYAPNKFIITGLYKNAFTFAFKAAKELSIKV